MEQRIPDKIRWLMIVVLLVAGAIFGISKVCYDTYKEHRKEQEQRLYQQYEGEQFLLDLYKFMAQTHIIGE